MPLLLALFGLSGAAALLHQVVWFRILTLGLGSSVQAAAAVLAGFMAGLAAGSVAGGHGADRLRSTHDRWVTLAAIEALTAASALGLLLVLPGIRGVPVAMLALALPAACMGATAPLVIRLAAVHGDRAPRLATLMAVNTAGAMIGVIAAALWLVPGIGLRLSGSTAAGLNLIVAMGATVMGLRSRIATPDDLHETPEAMGPAAGRRTESPLLLLFAAVVSGFATFALEIIWLRVLSAILLRPTVYTFAVVLTAVLAGLTAGGLCAAPGIRHSRDWTSWIAGAYVAAAAAVIASTHVLAFSLSGSTWPWVLAAAFAGMAATASALGFGLPIVMAARIQAGRAGEAGRRAGALLGANVAGAVAGALLAPFVLLPALETRGSLLLVAFVLAATGLILARQRASRRLPAWALTLVALAALGAAMPDLNRAALAGRYPGDRVVWQRDAPQAQVSVHDGAGGVRTLWLNGIHQANDSADAVAFHRLLARLPLELHGAARRYLSTGLGAGMTAGEASLTPGLEVDVVELSPEIVEAAALFGHVNHALLARPNVRVVVADARSFLGRAPSSYDVITGDAVVPRLSGGGILNSAEYFALVKGSLRPGGLFAKWIGPTETTAWKLIARTFVRAFPDATLWSDRILIGGLGERASRAPADPRLRALFTAGPAELRAFVGEGDILTDDRPRVEYFLSLPRNDPPVQLLFDRGVRDP